MDDFNVDDFDDETKFVLTEESIVDAGLFYDAKIAEEAAMTDRECAQAAKNMIEERGCVLDKSLMLEMYLDNYRKIFRSHLH